MNKLKKVLSVLCAFALLSVFVFEVSGTSAYAQQEDKNIVAEEDIIKLTDVLKKEDVSQSNIDNLIEKFKKGESFDCYKKEYSYIEPQVIGEGYKKTIYPDGSYNIESIEPLSSIGSIDSLSSITPLAIYSNTGVKISKWSPFISSSFKMDYRRNDSTNKAIILRQYDIYVSTVLGTYSNLKSGYWDDWRTETNAWISFDFKASNGLAQNRAWLKGYVNGSGYWTDHKY